jgi:hypothetical protein
MENLNLGFEEQERLSQLGGLLGAAGLDPYIDRSRQDPISAPPTPAPGLRTITVGLLSDSSEPPPFSIS